VTTRKTGPARAQGTRRGGRRARGYPSDLTDAQWQVITLYQACRRVRLVWADAGYTAGKLAAWAAALHMTVQVVAKRDPHAFQILPRRWVVDRTFAWISNVLLH
jgi:transposase